MRAKFDNLKIKKILYLEDRFREKNIHQNSRRSELFNNRMWKSKDSELLLRTLPLFCCTSVENGLDIFMPLDCWCTKGNTIKKLYQVPL